MDKKDKKTPIKQTLEEMRDFFNISEERHKELVKQAENACKGASDAKVVVMSAQYEHANRGRKYNSSGVQLITCYDDDGNAYFIYSDDENMLDAEIGKILGVTNREIFLCELHDLQEKIAKERGIPFVWKPPPEGDY